MAGAVDVGAAVDVAVAAAVAAGAAVAAVAAGAAAATEAAACHGAAAVIVELCNFSALAEARRCCGRIDKPPGWSFAPQRLLA